jgi:hypothetical protein
VFYRDDIPNVEIGVLLWREFSPADRTMAACGNRLKNRRFRARRH